MAHVPAFLYLFCTHVPAHAVLFAPEAAALHVPRSASHAYSEQVGLGRQRLDTSAQHRPLRRSPSPAVVRVCCVLSPFVSSPAPAPLLAPQPVASGGAGVLCAVALGGGQVGRAGGARVRGARRKTRSAQLRLELAAAISHPGLTVELREQNEKRSISSCGRTMALR